jgi:2-polyprenyl-3-methyl-5-hydroxy-6-metoxy-1,4-benzoquinol methylase
MAVSIESPIITTTPCGCCGGDAWSAKIADLNDYITHEVFQIDQCNACGLQMTQPLPGGDEIARYYPPRYRGNRHGFTGSTRSALRRRVVESYFPRGFKGRILDIGCGDGSFARLMKAHGWDVSATEIDSATVERLRGIGIDARDSDIATAEGFERKFDAITCWHVMEHLEHPRRVSQWVSTQLAGGGIFQVTVPNAASWQARFFGRRWVHLDVPRHRQHFSPATLGAMMQQAGFTVEHQSSFAVEYDWFGIIQSALNGICSRPNVLFDKLTKAPEDPRHPHAPADVFISYALAPAVAAISLPMMLAAAAMGDGATLTLTCRVKQQTTASAAIPPCG